MSGSGLNFFRNLWLAGGTRVIFLVIQALCMHDVQGGLVALPVIGNTASQSSPLPGYPASSAIDGDINTFSHTISGDPHPWWLMDLATEHCLGKITVALRRGCCGEFRFITSVVRAGASPNYAENQPCGLPATRAQSHDGRVNEFLCDPPRMSRYVSLDIDASNPEVIDAMLMLAEVTVDEYLPNECPQNDDPSPQPSSLVSAKSTHFKRLFEGALVGNPNPLSTLRVKSLTRCAAHCNKHAGCFSFDFSRENKQCQLHGQNSSDIIRAPRDEFSVYVSFD